MSRPLFKTFAGPFMLAGVVAVVVGGGVSAVALAASPADRIGWPMILAVAAFAGFTPIGIALLRNARLSLAFFGGTALFSVACGAALQFHRATAVQDETFLPRIGAITRTCGGAFNAVPAVGVGLAAVGWYRHVRGI